MDNASYHHKNLKEELIENGLRILDEDGYDRFSMRKVAKACGVSQTAPYRHFKNKESLVRAIITHAYRKFDDVLEEAVQMYPNDADKQLREMAFLYVKFFVENPEYLKFLFFSDVNQKMGIKNSEALNFGGVNQPYRTFVKTVESYQAEEQAKYGGRPMDLNALTLACWGLAHGIALLITRDNVPFGGDSLKLARKILWSDLFVRVRVPGPEPKTL